MATESNPYLTLDDYLKVERNATFRSDYVDGEMIPVVGASGDHASICVNIGAALARYLVPRGCRVFDSSLKVYTPRNGCCFYPDATVTCVQPEYRDDSHDTLLNPTLIIEVRSPSEGYHMSTKFPRYRSIPSFREFLAVDQDVRHVEHWSRAEGHWTLFEYQAPESCVSIPSLVVELPFAEIYQGIDI